jgi:hypothetical protein
MASAVLRDAAPHTDLHPIHGHGFTTDDEEDELEPETYKFVWYGPEHAIKKLQQYEHGVDTVNDLGWTTLMWAALEGAADVVEALLSEGANPFVASAVAWQPPGRRFAFPVGITALDLCQIALTDGVADVQETEGGHGHLWILRRLVKLFKVAELQAVRDVSNIDPYTNDYNHSRLPLTAHQSVVHITDSNYRERPYTASFAREGDTGLVFGMRGGRIVVADIMPGSAAAEIAAQDELSYVHGGYCHPRPPYMRKGLELSRINGQDVSQWGDLQMIQLLGAGYGSRDAELALQEAGRVVHAPGVLQESKAAGEQGGGDGEAAPLVAGSSLLDSIGSTFGSFFIDADTEAEKEAAQEAARRKERNEMMDLATEFLKSVRSLPLPRVQEWLLHHLAPPTDSPCPLSLLPSLLQKGMHAVRPVKFDFVAPKSAYLSGWMEGADAARAMDASKGCVPPPDSATHAAALSGTRGMWRCSSSLHVTRACAATADA